MDNFLEETLSAALYYIFSSLPAEPSDDKFFGMSPGSLARGHWAIDYLGHVFWDMVCHNLNLYVMNKCPNILIL